jgi:hypothetical protein
MTLGDASDRPPNPSAPEWIASEECRLEGKRVRIALRPDFAGRAFKAAASNRSATPPSAWLSQKHRLQ